VVKRYRDIFLTLNRKLRCRDQWGSEYKEAHMLTFQIVGMVGAFLFVASLVSGQSSSSAR
jgi:hypothetical protein